MTVAFCHSDREKILQSLKSSFRMTVAFCHSDRETVFASTRNLFVIPTRKDSSVTQSCFRMTLGFCHSDREAVFTSTRNLFVIPTGKDSSVAKKLFQNDTRVLSFRQRSFLLRLGISLLFRQAKILQSRKAPSE
jgi:uncharacterized protein YjiK